ncbi:hypothetical protein AB0950_39035 [Streptomyces sp. NPDC007189]|uniref:hypothetical protein n=1 Tax=Streptomyces sp. NPDC007189 TaxID=3154315 RepID=UPI00345113E8
MSTLAMFDTGVEPVTRIRVLSGSDAERREDEKPIAFSDCRYYCPDEATVRKVVEALRESDERLRSRPEELMLWEWEATFFEAEQGNPNGGGTILLGVAWYDEDFYNERKGAWFGTMHRRIYQQLGVPMENITVTHWRADNAA